jgi:hypothetical protein
MASAVDLLAQENRSLMRQIGQLKRRTVAERLAGYLLTLAREQGQAREVTLPFEKGLLASHLGTTPEHLSRAFATLRRYAVSTRHRRVVQIEDPDALAAFARLEGTGGAPEGAARRRTRSGQPLPRGIRDRESSLRLTVSRRLSAAGELRRMPGVLPPLRRQDGTPVRNVADFLGGLQSVFDRTRILPAHDDRVRSPVLRQHGAHPRRTPVEGNPLRRTGGRARR